MSSECESDGRSDISEVAVKLGSLGRELGAATVMFHSAAAERFGLSVTDYKCLDLAAQAEGPLTAGQIAELSGLSTGAVTGVIDRLERAGYARRVRDPHDRRKVLVEVSDKDFSQHHWMYEGLIEVVQQNVTEYTDTEIQAILRWLTQSIEMLRNQAVLVRDDPQSRAVKR